MPPWAVELEGDNCPLMESVAIRACTCKKIPSGNLSSFMNH